MLVYGSILRVKILLPIPNGVVVGGMEVTLIVVVSGTVVVVFEAVVVAGKTL